MYRVLLGILGVGAATATGVLVALVWGNVVQGSPQPDTPEAPWGDWESPMLGLIVAAVGLVVFPILGVRWGARLDARRRERRASDRATGPAGS